RRAPGATGDGRACGGWPAATRTSASWTWARSTSCTTCCPACPSSPTWTSASRRWRATPTPSTAERAMSDRANQVISDMLRRIHEAIVDNDVTYEEYQAAKQWFIDVGEAGEWPLFFDVYVE